MAASRAAPTPRPGSTTVAASQLPEDPGRPVGAAVEGDGDHQADAGARLAQRG